VQALQEQVQKAAGIDTTLERAYSSGHFSSLGRKEPPRPSSATPQLDFKGKIANVKQQLLNIK